MITAAVRAGAQVSVTVRMDAAVKCAITTIAADAWESIEYTDAVYDEDTGAWISRAEVAEIDFTDFTSRKRSAQVRAAGGAPDPDLNAPADGQGTLFQTWRHHAFFTTVPATTLGTVAADKTHRAHAAIKQVNADLKDSAWPTSRLGSSPPAQPGWWRPPSPTTSPARAGILAGGRFTKARTGTIRTRLVNVPARIATSARKIRLRLPENWPWQEAGNGSSPPSTALRPRRRPPTTQPTGRETGTGGRPAMTVAGSMRRRWVRLITRCTFSSTGAPRWASE